MHRTAKFESESLEPRRHFTADFGYAITGGSGGSDRGNALAVDNSGNTLIAGVFNRTVDFNPSSATTNLTAPATDSAFIAKYSASGSLVWAKGLGGSGEQNIQGLAVHGSGNVYAAGYFSGTLDFDPGPGVTKLTAKGEHDAFVMKLSSSGNFQWARQLGGIGDEGCTALAVDTSGNAYALAMFDTAGDYDPGPGTKTLANHGSFDVSLTKLNASGNFVYAVAVGGPGEDYGNGVSVGPGGTAVVAGTFPGTVDFDPGSGTQSRSSKGGKDVFVLRLNSTGGYRSVSTLGGTSDDQAGDIAVDHAGNAVVVGQFKGTADFDPSSAKVTLTSSGSTDAFAAKLTDSGTFVWARKIGGSAADRATNLAYDKSNNVYLTGQFTGTADFDPGPGVHALSSKSGSADLFAMKLTASGNYAWARATGGAGSVDVGEAIGVDNNGNATIAGTFAGSADFDPGSGTVTRTASGASDWLLWKLINA